MRIANRKWLLGVAAAAVLAFAVPVVAETTVLDMAQQQNNTLQAVTASAQPTMPEITSPAMPQPKPCSIAPLPNFLMRCIKFAVINCVLPLVSAHHRPFPCASN